MYATVQTASRRSSKLFLSTGKSVKNDLDLKKVGTQGSDGACENVRKPKGKTMSKLMNALLVTAGLALAGCAPQRDVQTTASRPMVPAAPMTKDAYDVAIKSAESQYKIDKDACSSRSGNAKDMCLAAANGRAKVAKADAEAAYNDTPKAREGARIARAEATYDSAKEKCDELAGNAKDVCVKEADAALVKAKADAKVDRVAADARTEASAAKREADYQVAIEKCDAFAGPAKDSCVHTAKAQFGK